MSLKQLIYGIASTVAGSRGDDAAVALGHQCPITAAAASPRLRFSLGRHAQFAEIVLPRKLSVCDDRRIHVVIQRAVSLGTRRSRCPCPVFPMTVVGGHWGRSLGCTCVDFGLELPCLAGPVASCDGLVYPS